MNIFKVWVIIMIHKTNIIKEVDIWTSIIISFGHYTGEQQSRWNINEYQNKTGINIYGHSFNEKIYRWKDLLHIHNNSYNLKFKDGNIVVSFSLSYHFDWRIDFNFCCYRPDHKNSTDRDRRNKILEKIENCKMEYCIRIHIFNILKSTKIQRQEFDKAYKGMLIFKFTFLFISWFFFDISLRIIPASW